MRPARRHAGLLLIVLTMVPLVYLSFQELGPLAGALSVVALACAAALALRVRERPDREVAANVAHIGLALLPGALTVYFAFQAGGFFPDGPAAGAVAVLAILILHTTLSERPFEGVSIPLIVAAASLAALAAWTLLSGLWSEAPARALIEFGRVMPYLLGLVLFGATPRTPERMSWIVRGLAAGCVTVCVVALVTRLLPDVWTVTPSLANNRLSYPLTYWNALGLLAVLGGVFSFHLAASDTESGVVRVLGAAAMPLVATTVLFTFSRGAILVALVALPLYAILARQRAFLGAAIATLPAVAVAVSAAYAANLLATPRPTTVEATGQGHNVAVIVALCVMGAALLRMLLLPLDRRLERFHLDPSMRRPVLASAWGASALVAAALAIGLGAPGAIADQYERFVDVSTVKRTGDLRDRLFDPYNNGRIDHWRVAWQSFEAAPLRGHGAGTYQLLWTHRRPPGTGSFTVDDAHSLYLEVLAELGVPGLVLLVVVLASVLGTLVSRVRGHDRAVYAALAAGGVAWAIRAGVDWDWEMPAVTFWLFAAGGAALATGRRLQPAGAGNVPTGTRVGLGLAWAFLAIAPVLIVMSELGIRDSRAAYRAGDCAAAVNASARAINALGGRPEPFEVLAYCNQRRGFDRLAIEAMEKAIERDPDNWEYRVGLALLLGAAGEDPRQAAGEAVRLNPRDAVALDAVARFRGSERRRWRELARGALRTRVLIADN